MIPAVLWKTGPVEEASLAPQTLAYLRSIAEQNPTYTVRYCSDRRARALLAADFADEPRILRAYDVLIPGAYRADLFRYCMLLRHGGVYGDLKQRYLAPLDAMVDRARDELVIVRDLEHEGHAGVQVSFIAAVAGLAVFRTAIDRLVENVERRDYGESFLAVTGPRLFRWALDRHPEQRCREELEQSGPAFIVWRHHPPAASRSRAAIHTKALPECSVASGRYAILWQHRAIFAALEGEPHAPCATHSVGNENELGRATARRRSWPTGGRTVGDAMRWALSWVPGRRRRLGALLALLVAAGTGGGVLVRLARRRRAAGG